MVYTGKQLKEIVFPLGGIGTGSIGLAGNGCLVDWEIFNRPNKGSINGYSCFAVKAEYPDGRSSTRVLQGDWTKDLIGKMYQDFNYVMKNGWWYHIEFESDPITKDDLRRFREYEAATSRTYGVEVLTCVICTANGKHIRTELTEGINTYRVKLIQMKKKDGDKILRKIQKKKNLKRKDLVPMLLSPLMGGKSEIKTRNKNEVYY